MDIITTALAGNIAKSYIDQVIKNLPKGMMASIDENDEEMLVFTNATTDSVVANAATFVAPTFTEGALHSIDTFKFDVSSKADDTFAAEKLPVGDTIEEAWVD